MAMFTWIGLSYYMRGEFLKLKEMTYVRAVIHVERPSQKGILIGQKGRMLKEIGKAARAEIQQLLEKKVYLDLWVKVVKNWRKKDFLLRRLGYAVKGNKS